ncbi:chalcone isomerase [Ranunculus cassubicifolius]
MGELLKVEGLSFNTSITQPPPPGSTNSFFLAGAGVRGLQIQEQFIKFTVIAIYLESDSAISSLYPNWKSKSAQQLMDSDEFFHDIVTGPFEKFMMVTMLMPLTGQQYSEKVMENCVAYWKANGTYTDDEAKAVNQFLQVFKEETFPPASSIVFTQSSPSLTIGFSKDGSIPKEGKATIVNKQLSEAILESMIGKNGVSPAAKRSIAERMSKMFKAGDDCPLI